VKVDIVLEGDDARAVEVKHEGGRYYVSIADSEGGAPQECAVDFDDSAGAAHLRIDGRSYLVEVSERGGQYAACVGTHCLEARLVTAEQKLREQLDGSLGSSANKVEAKMPGKVLEVFVEVGAQVAEGDNIAVLEAMKMENTIRAPKAGTIASVGVAKGDNVQAGQTIVEFEEST
jgi:biotin carboxyl carrier protein